MNYRSFPLSGRRRLRRVAIAGAAASTLAFGMLALPSGIPALQASAAPMSVASCQQLSLNYLCGWQNSNYSGTQWNLTGEDGYWWTVGSAANDKISSLYNHSLSYGFVAKNCPADSEWTYIGAGFAAPNLANNKWPDQTSMNDSISAFGIGGVGEPHPNFPDHGSRMFGGC